MTLIIIIIIHQVSGYSLWQEDEDTTAQFIAWRSTLVLLQKNILRDYMLSLHTLNNIHCFLLLKFAKASKRFYLP